MLKAFPNYYNDIKTLKKNEHLCDLILKNLKNYAINFLRVKEEDFKYKIVTMKGIIRNRYTFIVIDSGTNISIISEKFAKQLDICTRPLELKKGICLANGEQ